MGDSGIRGAVWQGRELLPITAKLEKFDSKITVQTQARSFARKVRIEFFLPARRGDVGEGNRPEQRELRKTEITPSKLSNY